MQQSYDKRRTASAASTKFTWLKKHNPAFYKQPSSCIQARKTKSPNQRKNIFKVKKPEACCRGEKERDGAHGPGRDSAVAIETAYLG